MLGYTENFGTVCPTKSNFVMPTLTFPGWQILVGFEWFVNVKMRYKNITESDQLVDKKKPRFQFYF